MKQTLTRLLDALSSRAAGRSLRTGIPILLLVFTPVSYTHLRAHETVLDLVCRLLLDK